MTRYVARASQEVTPINNERNIERHQERYFSRIIKSSQLYSPEKWWINHHEGGSTYKFEILKYYRYYNTSKNKTLLDVLGREKKLCYVYKKLRSHFCINLSDIIVQFMAPELNNSEKKSLIKSNPFPKLLNIYDTKRKSLYNVNSIKATSEEHHRKARLQLLIDEMDQIFNINQISHLAAD